MFKFEQKLTGQTGVNGRKDVEIVVPLKYLSSFWRTLEMPLANCEITLILTYLASFVIVGDPDGNQVSTFAITDWNQVSNEQPAWNRYQWLVTIQATKPYLDYLIDSNNQVLNRLFVLSFDLTMIRTGYRRHFLPTVEMKCYNAVIDRRNVFPVKNDPRTYDNTRKIAAKFRVDGNTKNAEIPVPLKYFSNFWINFKLR